MRKPIQLKIRTPLWTGDIDSKSYLLQSSGIIGSLRWWMEAVLREMGKFACDPVGDGRCPEEKKAGSKKINLMQGLAQFFDAHILFFPVASMVGPVWATSPMALEGLGLQQKFKVPDDGFFPVGDQLKTKDKLNFGWLMLKKGDGQGNINKLPLPEIIKQRAILVSDTLFSLIVNSNLEVRTSVSIDPQTGTAEEGALFTYEAIPRGTVLKFDIVYNSGKTFRVRGEELKTKGNGDVGTSWVKTQVEKGLKLFETLGIGGMGKLLKDKLKLINDGDLLEEIRKENGLASRLDDLMLAIQVLEKSFIYARYHAKALSNLSEQ